MFLYLFCFLVDEFDGGWGGVEGSGGGGNRVHRGLPDRNKLVGARPVPGGGESQLVVPTTTDFMREITLSDYYNCSPI